jgi:hypothetical protein
MELSKTEVAVSESTTADGGKPTLRRLIVYGILGWIAFIGMAFLLGYAVKGIASMLGY